MKFKVSAVLGGAVGVVATAAAAGMLVHERRQVDRAREKIDPRSAALFGALPVDREYRVRTEDGLTLYVAEVGPVDAALTVVFCHGFTLSLGSFHFQRLALQKAFGASLRMVLYDQRSHGRSDKSPSSACTIGQLGRDLASVLESRVPTGPAVLVGHSMGGMTVMALADQRPELFSSHGPVRSVVLINTSAEELRTVTLGLPAFVARMHAPVLPVILRRAAKNAALVEKTRALGSDVAWLITKRLSFATPDVDPAVVAYATKLISATPVDVVSDFFPALMSHDGEKGLRNLTDCDVLVIGADHDSLTPLSHSEAIADALPAAKFIVVGDSGHLLMMEHPEAVNRPLIRLVRKALPR